MGLGYQSLLKDLGIDLPVRLWTDSTAAIGICSRQGIGKVRHLDTHLLWVQQAVRAGRIDLRKVDGESNPADLFTKHPSSEEKLKGLVSLYDCEFRTGRPAAAPQVRQSKSDRDTIGDVGGEIMHTYMPHNCHRGADLDRLYPPAQMPP